MSKNAWGTHGLPRSRKEAFGVYYESAPTLLDAREEREKAWTEGARDDIWRWSIVLLTPESQRTVKNYPRPRDNAGIVKAIGARLRSPHANSNSIGPLLDFFESQCSLRHWASDPQLRRAMASELRLAFGGAQFQRCRDQLNRILVKLGQKPVRSLQR